MIKTKTFNILKSLLWKLSKRKHILLSPEISSVIETKDFTLIKFHNEADYLPIKYNYHTSSSWNITYHIRGAEQGLIEYSLSSHKTEKFCKWKSKVSLPFTLNLRLVNDTLFINDEKIETTGSIPKTSPWIIGNFSFKSTEGKVLQRTTAHRINSELNFLSESDYYEGQVYNNYDEEATSIPNQVFDSLKGYIPQTGNFLDVGCATGFTVLSALDRGFNAEGIDFSSWAVEKANIRTNGKCKVVNLDTASIEDFNKKYDIITMHSVIEHLEHPERAMKLLYDISSPNGIVYIQTLNADSLMHKVMKDDWGGYTDYTHKSPWISADWLEQTAMKIGFKVLKIKRYHLWNDNVYDEVWNSMNVFFEHSPMKTLLEEEYGDAVEIVLKRLA